MGAQDRTAKVATSHDRRTKLIKFTEEALPQNRLKTPVAEQLAGRIGIYQTAVVGRLGRTAIRALYRSTLRREHPHRGPTGFGTGDSVPAQVCPTTPDPHSVPRGTQTSDVCRCSLRGRQRQQRLLIFRRQLEGERQGERQVIQWTEGSSGTAGVRRHMHPRQSAAGSHGENEKQEDYTFFLETWHRA